MTKRIIESAKLSEAKMGDKFVRRVCLISEGESPRGKYPPEFFTEANAHALEGVMSFPNHPADYDRPDQRDPLTAVGHIDKKVTVERDPETGKLGLWSDYIVSPSRADVADHLENFSEKLGLSVFADCDGYIDPVDGKFVYTAIDGTDPYRSVDLVLAAGRGGKFQKVAESLGLLPKTSASAEENEVIMEIKDVEEVVAKALTGFESKIVESLVAKLGTQTPKVEELQAKVDDAAVDKIVESRLKDYSVAEGLISEAHLTKSQSDSLRELALKGEDVAPHIETAKKVLAEALEAKTQTDESVSRKIVEAHLGGDNSKAGDLAVDIAGFGKVKVL